MCYLLQKRDWQEQGYDRGHQNWAQAPGNKRGRFDGVPFRDQGRSDRGPQARAVPHFGGPPRFAHPMQKGPPGKHFIHHDAHASAGMLGDMNLERYDQVVPHCSILLSSARLGFPHAGHNTSSTSRGMLLR